MRTKSSTFQVLTFQDATTYYVKSVNLFQVDSRDGSLENFPSASDPVDVKVSKFGSAGSGIITGATTTITIGKPAQESSTISSFRSLANPDQGSSTVYLSPFADTISPAKPPLIQHQSLPRRKSGIEDQSPVTDSKSASGSKDPLLLFQDLAAATSTGGSLTRRNPPQVISSPLGRSSIDPSFFSTAYPIDGRRSAEPFGSIFLPSRKTSADISSCLDALDLQNLDLRNIDPVLAAEVLQESILPNFFALTYFEPLITDTF